MSPETCLRRGTSGQAIALSLCFIFVLWANLITPLWSDEWCRLGLAQDLAGVFRETWIDYKTWAGRIAPSFMAYYSFGPGFGGPVPWFEIVNTGMFVWLAWLLVRIPERICGVSIARTRGFAGAFAIQATACVALWWVPGSIGEAGLWKTGALVFLWPVAGAAFLLERGLAIRQGATPRPAAFVALLVGAVVFGTTLEPLVLATTLLLAALAWTARSSPRSFRLIAMIAAAHALGGFIMLTAPGNYVRAGVAFVPASLDERLMAWYWFLRRILDPAWIIAVAALGVVWVRLPRYDRRRMLRAALPGGIAAALYLAVLIPLPAAVLGTRVGFPPGVALAGVLVGLLVALPPLPRRDAALALLVGLVVLPVLSMRSARDLIEIAAIQRDWPAVSAVRTTVGERPFGVSVPPLEEGTGEDVVLPFRYDMEYPGRVWIADKHRFVNAIRSDPAFWINRCLAHAMEVPRVRAGN